MTAKGEAAKDYLGYRREEPFDFKINRSKLEKKKLVDSFQGLAPNVQYGDDNNRFKEVLNDYPFAPEAYNRAKEPYTQEWDPNSEINYFVSNEELKD